MCSRLRAGCTTHILMAVPRSLTAHSANTMIVHDRFATLQTFGQSIIVLLQPRLISSDTLLNGTTLESLRSIIMGPFPCRSCDPPESWYRNYLDDRGNGLPGFNDHNM